MKTINKIAKIFKWFWLIAVTITIGFSLWLHQPNLALWQGIALIWSLMVFRQEKLVDRAMKCLEKSGELIDDMHNTIKLMAAQIPTVKKLKIKHKKNWK